MVFTIVSQLGQIQPTIYIILLICIIVVLTRFSRWPPFFHNLDK